MKEKTYGQINYEAYNESKGGLTYDGKPIPSWDENDNQSVKDGWEAGANAVIDAYIGRVQSALEPTPNAPCYARVKLDISVEVSRNEQGDLVISYDPSDDLKIGSEINHLGSFGAADAQEIVLFVQNNLMNRMRSEEF